MTNLDRGTVAHLVTLVGPVTRRMLPTRCRDTTGTVVVATRARWRVEACPVERSRVSFGVSISAGELGVGRSERENAGLGGKSSESPENIIGLSASVECVGAGESGYERVASVVDRGDETVGDVESLDEEEVADIVDGV